MNIRKPCNLARMYAGPQHPIDLSCPEVGFMQAVCANDADKAVSYFREKKLFDNLDPVIDAPYERFVGLDGVRRFAEGFNARFNAVSSTVTPVIQTRSGGRAVLEMVANFVVDGEIEEVPMFVVADLRTKDLLDEVRIYCHFSFVPGLEAYRAPLFPIAHREMGDPGLMTGAPRVYYEALHHVPNADVDRLVSIFGEGCTFGGYEPWGREANHGDPAQLRQSYENMSKYIPSKVAMRYETLIDDGKTCVIEWVHVISRRGREDLARVAMSGIAAYERSEDGLLCSIRISDYAGYERTIDWSKLPVTLEEAQQVNFVETFPAGVGQKKQFERE